MKKILIGVSAFVVLLLGVVTVKAEVSQSFWNLIANKAGEVLGNRLADQSPKEEPKFGSGNFSLVSSVQKADICKITAINTTTVCVFQNLDQDLAKRVVREITWYADSLTTSTNGTATFSAGSSSTLPVLTNEKWNTTSFASSSSPQSFSTTTYTTAANRIWNYADYLVVTSTATLTSTGYVKVIYDKIPTQ